MITTTNTPFTEEAALQTGRNFEEELRLVRAENQALKDEVYGMLGTQRREN